MKIGVPTEIKKNENRVGLNPQSVKEIVDCGHEVFVQAGAGNGIFATDEDYRNAGVDIMSDADDVFETCDLIVSLRC